MENDNIDLKKKLTRALKELTVMKDQNDILQRENNNLIMKFSNKEREVN